MVTWNCTACGGENPEGMRFCGHCGTPATAALRSQPSGEHEIAEALRSFVAGPVAEKLVEAGGKLPEERRLITALFADVSGFTSLADRLDPEQLLEVIDPVISGLSSVVGRYGGYVEKFAGDALMALFGAPVSHEDDADRALLVALEMHAELARLVRELPHEAELTLHVGVNSGHGIARILGSEARMDYAVLGDSVILAQRLESAAPPGQTYVSEATVGLTESDFEFEPVGALRLKGKAEPVAAWRLVRPRECRSSAFRGSLIGREAELAIVDEVLAVLASGAGGLLAITGEPGIGKSRLVAAAADRAVTVGGQCLHARCISYGAGLAYWPYLDLIRRAADLRNDEQPAETRARLDDALTEARAPESAPFFARLLGLPAGEHVATLEPEAFQRGLHDAFRRWIGALCAAKPLVLVLEDIHWADASSLMLTTELAQYSRDAALLFLLVGREEARDQIETVAGAAEPRAIGLGPLDSAAIVSLAEALLGGTAPQELVSFVERRTGGNPLFVQELIRTLRDSGALTLTGSGWAIRTGWDARSLPPTIEGVLAARIDLLPREAATLLQTASIIGRRTRVALLQGVAGAAMSEGALDELARSGFVDRVDEDGEPTIAFRHALVQDTAYSRLLRRHRRELHLRVADVAEALYGSGDHVIDLLARHLYLGDSPRAADYLVRAGERAKRLFANQEAILHFRRAAEVAENNPALAEQRVELRASLADLQELVGNYDEALRLYTEIRERWNDVRGWRGSATVLRKLGRYEDALAEVEKGFADPALQQADLTPLWLEQGWSLSVMGRFDQAIDVLQAALLAAGDARTVVVGNILLQLARAETVEGQLESALARCFIAKSIFDELGDLRAAATTHRIVGDVYRLLKQPEEAAEWLRRGLEVAQRIGSVEEIGGCLINLGLVEHERGAVAEAIECDRRAIAEFERFGHASGRAQGYSNLAWMLAEVGEYEEALGTCDKALELARTFGLSLIEADVYDTMASVELGKGNITGAGRQAEKAAALYLRLGANPKAADSLELAATAWERAGKAKRARESRARARDLTTQLA